MQGMLLTNMGEVMEGSKEVGPCLGWHSNHHIHGVHIKHNDGELLAMLLF